MKTLIRTQAKLKIANFDSPADKFEKKMINSRIRSDYKFYQKLFGILLISCTFLIFPESPQDSDVLCKKYHSTEACIVW